MTPRPLVPTGGNPHGRRGRSLNSRVLQLSAFALSFILVALLVVTSSRAAFVAQNDNIANSVSSATIDLTDNDSNTAMFAAGTVTNLMPNTPEERCITVSYTGNITPTEVKMYIASALPSTDLADYLNLKIEIGAATNTFRDCTGFNPTTTLFGSVSNDLYGFATAYPNYATSLATGWTPTPTGPDSARTFRFTISVQDVPAAEGKSTTFGFSWETRTAS
jgi:hypothetical protein